MHVSELQPGAQVRISSVNPHSRHIRVTHEEQPVEGVLSAQIQVRGGQFARCILTYRLPTGGSDQQTVDAEVDMPAIVAGVQEIPAVEEGNPGQEPG
jgi:hypothetical protein